MVDELTSLGWKRLQKEETKIDEEMDAEAVFKLVDVNNSGSITKTVQISLHMIYLNLN